MGQSAYNYRYDAYGQLLPAHGNASTEPFDYAQDKLSAGFTDPHNHYTFSGKEWDEHLDSYEFGYRQYSRQRLRLAGMQAIRRQASG